MKGSKPKVVYLNQRDPVEALERLNRITGLSFSSWPQSLCSDVRDCAHVPRQSDDLKPTQVDAPPEVVSG